MKREFLQLAHDYASRHNINGWYWSEKLDGVRCFWDGGVTMGRPKSEVPWANCSKDGRYVSEQICTGLWSRYGNVIHAPKNWLETLPRVCLDGELWIPGARQDLASIIKKLTPDSGEWGKVKYYVFDAPSAETWLGSGVVTWGKVKRTFDSSTLMYWRLKGGSDLGFALSFEETLVRLGRLNLSGSCQLHEQKRLTLGSSETEAHALADQIVDRGGEGVIVRRPVAMWEPYRTWNMLKIKPIKDAEGVIVGWNPGLGKLSGMMGSLDVLWNGVKFSLSGFTEFERTLNWRLGDKITFQYRCLTNDGVPQEARYLRPKSEEM